MTARHVGCKSHREGKRLYKQAKDFNRDQNEVNQQGKSVRHDVLEVSDKAVRLRTRDDNRKESNHCQSSSHVEVTGCRRASVDHLCEKRFVIGVDYKFVQNIQRLENRDHSNQIGTEDENKERKDQRRPRVDPLLSEIRKSDAVTDELHEEFQTISQTRRRAPRPDVTTSDQCNDQENRGRDDPQHENVFSDGKVDTEDLRQMNQGVFKAAVGDMLGNECADIEGFLGSRCTLGSMLLNRL